MELKEKIVGFGGGKPDDLREGTYRIWFNEFVHESHCDTVVDALFQPIKSTIKNLYTSNKTFVSVLIISHLANLYIKST
jgi:hypothetical protein